MKIFNPIAKKGEDLAADFLKKQGYKILDRNYHIKGGEVDIIAIDKSDGENTLVFIEVKTRTSNAFGTPFEAITHRKLKAMMKVLRVYALSHPKLPKKLRIDAVSVLLNTSEAHIELLQNIDL